MQPLRGSQLNCFVSAGAPASGAFGQAADFGDQVGAPVFFEKIADELFVTGLTALQECRLEAFFFA